MSTYEQKRDYALSSHESLCDDQTQACGDCRRLKADIDSMVQSEVRQGVNYVLGSLVLDSGDKFTPRQSDLASKALERFLAALKEVKK